MPLQPGTTLGPYSVTALIGEGGMGQVYQATDTTLNRQVALKILPEAFATDPDRLARFQREAQVLASLNHPNIAAIYGIEESGDTRALVLELVEGPTLADRIAQGAIPVDEALPIAKQIAEALEAAHEAGVIHRDLKPANIKVRDDGTVKVLDFGLAKALDTTPEGDPSQSPTLTAAATQMGVIMGTAAYMSPEQARGKPVDKRADIWAFGVVLYEMLTGAKPFPGDDISQTLARVIDRDPDWQALPKTLPPASDIYLRQCLQRDPRERVRDIGDVRLALGGAYDAAASVPATYTARRVGGLAWVASLIATVVATGLAVWILTRGEVPRLTRLSVSTLPPVGLVTGGTPSVALSPDGSKLAYVSDTPNRQIYIRDLGQLEPIPLRGAEGINPFFSPDGNWVGYRGNDDALKKVSVHGGPPVTLAEGLGGILGATWSSDDTIAFASVAPGGLLSIGAAGGERRFLTTLAEGEIAHRWPEFLPGDEAILFAVVKSESTDVAVLDLRSGVHTTLISGGSNPRYAPTGHVLYGLAGTLLALPFDLDQLSVAGAPVTLLEGVVTHATRGAAHFGMSEDGSLAYVTGGSGEGSGRNTLVWLDREGNEEPLDADPGDYYRVRLSPDGTRIAVDFDGDVHTYDIVRGLFDRVTTSSDEERFPIWTPDGMHLVFESRDEGVPELTRIRADGTGSPEPILVREDRISVVPFDWTPDGETLLFGEASAGDTDIGTFSTGDDSSELLIDDDFRKVSAAVSPDGHWIAYSSDRTGQLEVYVQPFPDLGARHRISTSGGTSPRWSPHGTELFYQSLDGRQLLAVPIATEPTFRPGVPEPMFEGSFLPPRGSTRSYDVEPITGDRFLVIKTGGSAGDTGDLLQIILVQNWFEELKRLVPADP